MNRRVPWSDLCIKRITQIAGQKIDSWAKGVVGKLVRRTEGKLGYERATQKEVLETPPRLENVWKGSRWASNLKE